METPVKVSEEMRLDNIDDSTYPNIETTLVGISSATKQKSHVKVILCHSHAHSREINII